MVKITIHVAYIHIAIFHMDIQIIFSYSPQKKTCRGYSLESSHLQPLLLLCSLNVRYYEEPGLRSEVQNGSFYLMTCANRSGHSEQNGRDCLALLGPGFVVWRR